MRTFTADARSANETAESRIPNSSACSGVTRPDTTGRASVRLAHQRVDVAVEHVVESRRAAAREREPEHRHGEQSERRNALCADEHPRGTGEEQQRHDSRLRQREVVPGGGERRCLAAEGSDDDDQGGAERYCRGTHVESRRPRGVAAPRHDAPQGDRDQKHPEHDDRPPHEGRIREPGEHDVADEQRQCDEGDPPVRRSEIEPCADDDQRDRDGTRHGGRPKQHARRDRSTARRVRARDAAHAASSGGRSGASRWSRTAPRRSCAAAAGRWCTTRAYPPATGRCPRECHERSSARR